MKNKYLWVTSIMAIVLLLDQYTKHFVDTHIRRHEIITIIPGFFNLTNVRNPGAAFGILSGMLEAWRSVFFVSVTLTALIVIAILIRKTQDRLLVFAFSLIAGGAVGNVIDRVRYGEVVDFIQWYVKSYYWPSFNVADSAISIGVGLLAIDMMFLKKPEPGESTKS
jgi:signal peptidase II